MSVWPGGALNDLPLRQLAECAGRSTTSPAVVGRFYWVNEVPYITVETEVDIDLAEIDTDDLLDAISCHVKTGCMSEKQKMKLVSLANGVAEPEEDSIDAIYQAIIRNDPAMLHRAASDLIYNVKGRIV